VPVVDEADRLAQTQPLWDRREGGLQHKMEEVHLGAIPDSEGVIQNYRDAVESPVPAAGISVIVSQSSFGYTGVSVRSHSGFTVESGRYDPTSGQVNWASPNEGSDPVVVTGDMGNMGQYTPLEGWTHEDVGNPGIRGGAVRVTGEDGYVRYFAVGANFAGVSDNWVVRGGIVEVQPYEDKLPTTPPALPPTP
jgi:hypothetical protein